MDIFVVLGNPSILICRQKSTKNCFSPSRLFLLNTTWWFFVRGEKRYFVREIEGETNEYFKLDSKSCWRYQLSTWINKKSFATRFNFHGSNTRRVVDDDITKKFTMTIQEMKILQMFSFNFWFSTWCWMNKYGNNLNISY